MAKEPNFSQAYAVAGVDTQKGTHAVELIKPLVESTKIPGATGNIGGFGGTFEITSYIAGMKKPSLVTGVDGVGTKMLVAQAAGNYETVGIDCVAMCVNDIACSGALPLFFLDTVSCGQNDPKVVYQLVKGIAEGCKQAGIALIGGEMAEKPDMLKAGGTYDLEGFACGIVDAAGANPIGEQRVEPGDILIGLASNGIHSNGFTLVRRMFNERYGSTEDWIHRKTQFPKTWRQRDIRLSKWLLKPTSIYVRMLQLLMQQDYLVSAAHITGGGLFENVPRALPNHLAASIDQTRWLSSANSKLRLNEAMFRYISLFGNISEYDMFHTFNMGVGMVLVVKPNNVDRALNTIKTRGILPYILGNVVMRENDAQVIFERELSRDLPLPI